MLKSTGRELSTLSPTLRSAWDGRPLALLTRTAPARATEAHISIIGHITQTELRRHTTTVEIANGFLNRFIFAAVRRVRLLPEGGDPDPLKGTGLGRYLTTVLRHAHTAGTAHAHPRRARAVVAHLPAADPARRRSPRAAHRPRRSARDPARAPLHAARRTEDDPARASPRRARALGLRRTAPPPGRSDKRPATRSPSRSTPRSPAHPTGSPAPRSATSANATSPPTASSKHSPRSPPPAAPPATHPHRRPPRRTLDRRRRTRRLTRDRYARVGRIARPPRRTSTSTPSRTPATLVASDHSDSEAVTNARRTTTRPPTRPPFIASRFPAPAATPLVVRSFASPITIFDGAVITIQRVRQHWFAASDARSHATSGSPCMSEAI